MHLTTPHSVIHLPSSGWQSGTASDYCGFVVPAGVCLQFLSLLQNNMLQDMVVLYAAERKIITVLKFGVPVCGHPTIVHGEQYPIA